MFENEWFPRLNAIGVSWEEFWNLNPHIANLLLIGHRERMHMQDEQMWFMGMYMKSAVETAIEHVFAGKKASSKYIEEPILKTLGEDDGLTQEERDEKELRKMLLYEEQWAMNDRMRGLPETKIL